MRHATGHAGTVVYDRSLQHSDALVSLAHALELFGAGVLAGIANAAAGGGTLVSFPALLAVGQPPLLANVTSTAGLLPGYGGGCLGYRHELAAQRWRLWPLGIAAAFGGLAGAVILLAAPPGLFAVSVPWLVGASCLLLAAQPVIAGWIGRRQGIVHRTGPGVCAATLACSAYGSFFGAGLGVVLLAVLGVSVAEDVQRVNALKAGVSLVANTVGVAYFAMSTQVAWGAAGALALGAFGGGHLGALLARRLTSRTLRLAVLTLGTGVTIWLFVR